MSDNNLSLPLQLLPVDGPTSLQCALPLHPRLPVELP